MYLFNSGGLEWKLVKKGLEWKLAKKGLAASCTVLFVVQWGSGMQPGCCNVFVPFWLQGLHLSRKRAVHCDGSPRG